MTAAVGQVRDESPWSAIRPWTILSFMVHPKNSVGQTSRTPEEVTGPAQRLTSEQVWRVLGRTGMAILGHVTPAGEPRTSGVLYEVVDRRLYIAVAPDSF